jgi:glucose-6-phosphate dehydrogenase assembly protein OpcA
MQAEIQTIERELSRLWKDAADPQQGKAVMRTCTLNLIVFASDQAEADRLALAIQELTASHPNRTVMLVADPEAEQTSLDAWVQANCLFTAPGQPQLCGEQVTIVTHGASGAQAAGLVLSLLLPDLPVIAYWPGVLPFDDPIVARLRGAIDRLILDSASLDAPLTALALLSAAQHGDALHKAFTLSDLHWARLTPWRELIAQFFDTRAWLPHLHRLDDVEIVYAAKSDEAGLVTALYMAAWLCTSLNWQLFDGLAVRQAAEATFSVRRPAANGARHDTRTVTVRVRPEVVGDETTLVALRLRALDYTLATFSAEWSGEQRCVRTSAHIDQQAAVTRLARVEERAVGELLAGELRLLSADHTYTRALAFAAELAQRLA